MIPFNVTGAFAVLLIAGIATAADECAEPASVYLETLNLFTHEDYNDYVTVEIFVPAGSQQFTFAATTTPADIVAAFNWMGFHLGWQAQVYDQQFVEVVSTSGDPDDFIGIQQSASIDGIPVACTEPEFAACSDYAIAYPTLAHVGDLDCDKFVGVADLLLLLASWGACDAETDCAADLDGNGVIGVDDLLLLLENWM